MDSRITPQQQFASATVLIVLTLERLAYYALISTFYLFLNKGPWSVDEGWDSLDALNAVFVLLGVSYISALVGGYVSDAWMGRFRTIVCGMLLYILGFILLILITVDKLPRYICSFSSGGNSTAPNLVDPISNGDDRPHAPCKPAVYIALVVLGTGVGMVKANIGPFGAEQLGPSNPSLARSFFNWYYWCVNVGSVVGIAVLAFVEQDNPGICTNGFLCGYSIATACLGLALVILLSLGAVYELEPASGNSPLFNIIRITWEAIRLNIRDWRIARQHNNPPPLVRPKFLDLAKVRNGGRFHETAVDDVRAVGNMLALFASLLPYWLVYFQMQTSFQAQGLHMRFMLNMGDNTSTTGPASSPSYNSSYAPSIHSPLLLAEESENHAGLDEQWQFSIPAAWLTLFNQVFLILSLPLLTKFIYPYLDRRGVRLSMLSRIGVGMFVSCLAVFTAGGLETFRTVLWKTDNSTHIIQTVGNATFHAVDISIFWQVPQYVLVAGAESLASIAGLEYAYSEAPRSFQSLIMGLFYAMEGVGSFLGIALLQMIAPFWLNNMTDYANINDNHLDFYLYFLGIIQLITLVLYVVFIYLSRFTLELVPLRCDEGIGGPLDPRYNNRRRNNARTGGFNALAADDGSSYRQLIDESYEDRLRRPESNHTASDPEDLLVESTPPFGGGRRRTIGLSGGDDEDLIDVSGAAAGAGDDLVALEDSDESVGVNETPSGVGVGPGEGSAAQY